MVAAIRPEEYPVSPPEGIFHFPQGIFCLAKQEDTGKESVRITRVSGNEFKFEITSKKLGKAEKSNYPIRICEFEKPAGGDIAEKNPEKEPREITKSETRIDLTKDNTHRVTVQDGDIVRIGNTITYSAGTNLITLDDSAGAGDTWNTAYTMESVLSNCGAVVTKQGANAYDVSARMLFLSGVYFISESEFVELKPNPVNPVYTIDGDAGSHIRIGKYDSDDDYSYNGSFWRIYINSCTGTRLNRFDGELLIYGSNIWTDGASYVDSLNFWGTTRIFDTEMEGNAYISGEDINFQRVTWMGKRTMYDMLYASGYDFPWAGIKAMNCQKGIFLSGTVSSPIDLYDVTIVDCTSSVYVSGNELMRIINSSFDRNTTYVPANRIGIQECYTFNVLVTDASNAPLSGALVALKDKNDLPIFSICTGADGKLPTDQIVKAWENNHNVKTDFNDHKLKITLNGYSDYETEIEIDHQIKDDQVCLDALTYTYDDLMTGLNDIKGTGFVKDTHSLTDIEEYTDVLDDVTNGLAAIKAEVGGLGGAVMRGTNGVPTNPLLDNDVRIDTIAGDVAGLGGAIMRGTDSVPTNPLLTNDARLDNLDAAISSRADENPPSQVLADYKADVAELTVDATVIRRILNNRLEIDEDNSKLVIYDDAGAAPLYEWPLTDSQGNSIVLLPGPPVNRGQRTL